MAYMFNCILCLYLHGRSAKNRNNSATYTAKYLLVRSRDEIPICVRCINWYNVSIYSKSLFGLFRLRLTKFYNR